MSVSRDPGAASSGAEGRRGWIDRCLELAERFRGRTSPNPIVGCVIEQDGAVLAEGAHRGPGTPHAEADALAKLGGRAPGATLWVNLEPCNHHGRTPPCAPAVLASGVTRVVVGARDPIADHAGGIDLLRAGGVQVDVLDDAACIEANRPFYTWARHKRCAFTLKAGMSLDGRIATAAGESKWITSEAARADAHRLRDTHDVVLVGINTVLADDPALTTRIPDGRDAVRVVVDSQLRTPASARVLSGGRTIIATCSSGALSGAELWRFPDARVPLDALAVRLAEAGLLSVLVEGGATIHAALLASALADTLVFYAAPLLLGGTALPVIGGSSVPSLAAAPRFRFLSATPLGPDIRLTAVNDSALL